MAHVVPSNVASLALAGGRRAELDTVQLLQRKLDDAYTVFHRVHWTRAYPSGTQIGEIDLVVVNRDGRVLVIEQRVTPYTSTQSQQRALGKILADLIGAGFEHGQIVVLTARHLHSGLDTPSAFAAIHQVGKLGLRRFSGKYDLFGNQVLTEGKIPLDSLYRFKGREAPAVVVTDLDDEFAASPDWQRALFTATTRATVRLELLVQASSALQRLVTSER